MKSLVDYITESQDNGIKKIAKNIESYNDKDQRCTPNESQAIILDTIRKFEKENAKKITKVPSDEEFKEGTWLAVHEDTNMILFQWDFNHFNTYYIQEKDRKESVICGAIYMDSKELNEFLIGKIGGDPVIFYNINKEML
ncbi:MAG: hypothetical protein J1F35_08105 [Erysipelotrichales bacterium]|nr:hypothetical protein [Erysipelotrichales bacterium]